LKVVVVVEREHLRSSKMTLSLYICPYAVDIILAESENSMTPQYGCGVLPSGVVRFYSDPVLTVWMKEWRNSDESRLQTLLTLLFVRI
jgi:hypothetical protein